AARCGGAVYGLSPFNTDPQEDGLEPVLSWQSTLAQVKRLEPGQSTGYRRRFVAEAPTWIGIVPVGYGDGFRRDLTGTEVRVAGEPRHVVGTVSMDSFAAELDRELLERARKGAPANVTFVEGDATNLPFETGSFDLACSRRTLHHIAHPEAAIAELARVTVPGGHVYVDDQIAPVDPLAALDLDRF